MVDIFSKINHNFSEKKIINIFIIKLISNIDKKILKYLFIYLISDIS